MEETSGSRGTSKVVLLALAGLVAVAAGVSAHQGHQHQAMGTVKMIHENHLILTVSGEKEQTFVLSAATKFVRGTSEATRDDVAVGERAVVMYETKEGADHALEVKLGEKKP